MTHNVHPYAFRIGIIRDWKSRWFNRAEYKFFLKEDTLLREWLEKKLRQFLIESVEIERSHRECRITVRTPRPGLLIGRGGEGIEKLKNEIIVKMSEISNREPSNAYLIKITVEEVKSPDSNAAVAARLIAQDLEKRMSFRRVMKQHLAKIMNSKEVKGVRILLKGRLDGAEMGRREWLKDGRIPLQTLRADIDYARESAVLPYGTIGIKVWIYKGEIFAEGKGDSSNSRSNKEE